jgi:hypothetical protein
MQKSEAVQRLPLPCSHLSSSRRQMGQAPVGLTMLLMQSQQKRCPHTDTATTACLATCLATTARSSRQIGQLLASRAAAALQPSLGPAALPAAAWAAACCCCCSCCASLSLSMQVVPAVRHPARGLGHLLLGLLRRLTVWRRQSAVGCVK